ncbi:hypothetical protein C2G38_2230646 [Gigaspora rosea]|uniref:Uncharacterized protein n=1 Tax=Gigaspora rosea TaxID=44941 RepID=A0A397TTY7_9GLOM|nr:hypothetical protein C2G38_2230646 [Gigaspora rosea]
MGPFPPHCQRSELPPYSGLAKWVSVSPVPWICLCHETQLRPKAPIQDASPVGFELKTCHLGYKGNNPDFPNCINNWAIKMMMRHSINQQRKKEHDTIRNVLSDDDGDVLSNGDDDDLNQSCDSESEAIEEIEENNTSKPKAKPTNKFSIIANSKLLQKGLAVASGINDIVPENIKNNQRSKESKMSKPKTKPTNKSSIISNSKSSKKDLLAVDSGINDVAPVSIKDNQQKEKKKTSKNSSQKDLTVALGINDVAPIEVIQFLLILLQAIIAFNIVLAIQYMVTGSCKDQRRYEAACKYNIQEIELFLNIGDERKRKLSLLNSRNSRNSRNGKNGGNSGNGRNGRSGSSRNASLSVFLTKIFIVNNIK